MSQAHTQSSPLQNESSNKRQVLLAASVVAAFSAYYYSLDKSNNAALTLTPSYALCAEDRIYTVDVKRTVDCILVDKYTVSATGTLKDIQSYWDDYQNELIREFYGNEPSAKKSLPVHNLPPGSVVVPGLTAMVSVTTALPFNLTPPFPDSHAHLLHYGFKMQLRLDEAQSLAELLDTLERYAQEHPSGPDVWIEALGWDHTRWTDTNGSFPTAADLASRPALTSIPIALHRIDAHALWISPRAIALTKAHLNGSFPDSVPGGQIVYDTSTGEPTGIFVDAAQALVPVPKWSTQLMREYADRAVKDAVSVGLTNVHDAATSVDELELFKQMEEEGQLPIRVYAMADSDRISSEEVGTLEVYDRDPAARVRMRSVKLFTDGALGSWGAAMLSPYTDKPDAEGIMRYPEPVLSHIARSWWDRGWGVNIHAIGDRANKAVLDVFESIAEDAADEDAVAKRRPRIEHAQIMRMEDLARAGKLGVVTSVQPTHATSDMWYAEARMGAERIKGAYAYQTLLQSSRDGILPLGSDFPVESINPLFGFYAAVARLDIEGKSPHGEGGWFPAERLTRAQALKGMTLDAAYAAFAEDTLGSLTPGKRADFVVLDRDIMDEDLPVSEILQTKVKATVIDGRIAFGAI